MSKGSLFGECKRSTCNTGDARWYNVSTRGFYCSGCAMNINRQSEKFDRITLCYYVENDTQAAEIAAKPYSYFKSHG